MKRQTLKRQAVQQLRIYSSLIRSAIWSSRALSLGTKVTTSDNFRASFKTLSYSQPAHSLIAADERTNPETAGRTAIENIKYAYIYINIHIYKILRKAKTRVIVKRFLNREC